jgi:hypothetical protein
MSRKLPADDMTAEALDQLAATGTDRDWQIATGACGGCGSPTCHRGKLCTEPVCKWCPSRNVPCPSEV